MDDRINAFTSTHFFDLTEENNKLELFTATFDEFSFTELKDELEEIFCLSDITPKHPRHEIIETRIIIAYEKLRLENSSTDGYPILFLGYFEISNFILETLLLWIKK